MTSIFGSSARREGGLHEALQAERQRAQADAGARAEDGVGEDRDAVDLEQHGGVAEPGGVQAGIGPEMRVGTMRRRQNLALEVANDTTPVHLAIRCGVGSIGCVRYIDGVASGKDPLRLGIHVTVYVALYFATAFVFSGLLVWLGGYLTGVTGDRIAGRGLRQLAGAADL